MSVEPLLRVRGLMKSFGGVQAVADLGFDLHAGERLALIGPNGAGKTTCFNLLDGQLRPDRGRIEFAGRDIAGMRPRDIARLGVGRTFQVAAAFASMSVRENVQVALLARERKLGSPFAAARHSFGSAADALLERTGLLDHARRPCGVLSYGDLKRLEFALALAGKPRLLLMDEPTAGMAAAERAQMMREVSNLARDSGVAILFTEHDMDVVFGHAERILVLHRGEAIAAGTPEEVRADARAREVYLGTGLEHA